MKLSDKIQTIFYSPFFKKSVIFVVILLAIVIITDKFVMPSIVHNKETVIIPSLVNIKFEDALLILDSLSLRGMEGGTKLDPKIKIGRVIIQNPAESTLVRKGRRVYLTISGGEEKTSVPSLRGKSIRDAKFSLERLGLNLGDISYVPSEDFPPGTIISQSIEAGAKIGKRVAISIGISQGKNTDRISVPDVTDKLLKDAIAFLKSKNFTIGAISYQPTLEYAPNTVLDQYPLPGEMVPLGQSIDLFVAEKQDKVIEN
ncbi:MAG: PASTA domain-containing protein [Bacteroidota bacterium]